MNPDDNNYNALHKGMHNLVQLHNADARDSLYRPRVEPEKVYQDPEKPRRVNVNRKTPSEQDDHKAASESKIQPVGSEMYGKTFDRVGHNPAWTFAKVRASPAGHQLRFNAFGGVSCASQYLVP
eukprot:gene10538-12468_t